MNHFEEILCQGESIQHHNFQDNQELFDKSTNQSNLNSAAIDTIQSPFDSSPKANTFYFSLNSPKQNADNFHFHSQNSHSRKNSKDYIQTIGRRLQFQEDPSLFCQEQEVEQEYATVKEQEVDQYDCSDTPQKGKKIRKTKNSKGLKNLSVGVYQIVAEKTQTSYKQVANTLIEKLNKKAKEDMTNGVGYDIMRKVEKDQHNIKRRVYDALNVLISAQLLRKQGKRVICNNNVKSELGNREQLSKQLDQQKIKIKQQQFRIAQKKNQLIRLQGKYKILHYLIQKNKRLGPAYSPVITLPFITLKTDLDKIQSINLGSNDVEIKYKGNILLMGDVDTIQEFPITLTNET